MRQVVSRLRPLCCVADPPFLRFRTGGSIAFLLVGCLLIVAWQAEFIEAGRITPGTKRAEVAGAGELDRTYALRRHRGLYQKRAQRYFYFFYYTHKFPISTHSSVEDLRWDRSSAWRELGLPDRAADARTQAGTPPSLNLIMEDYAFLRTGDLGKIFLLYPDAWAKGTPWRASVRWFNRLLGIGSLLALFVSLSLLNCRLFASTLVLVLGSNPFQLIELYARNDIFGYPIAVASLMLALHAPLILGRWRHGSVYVLPLLSGVFLASFREVRLEPALVILSVAATYLLVAGRWQRRVLMVATLALAAATTTAGWGFYWQAKFDDAYEIVQARGGETFDGVWNRHHALWHAIWCGLGDTSRNRGYRWSDQAAYRFGIPRVNARFGRDYRLSGGHLLQNYHTSARKHRIKPETLEEYSIVMRDKVLGDVQADPGWYATVIKKRFKRLFRNPTPIRLGLGARYLDVPWTAWLLIPALLWAVLLRRPDQIALLGFYASTSLTTIAVYSGERMTFNSAFHQMLFAVVVCWVVHGAYDLLRAGRSPRSGGSRA